LNKWVIDKGMYLRGLLGRIIVYGSGSGRGIDLYRELRFKFKK